MKIKIILFALLLFFCRCIAYADTLILKSGQKIEGKIIEKTNDYVKIDFQGVTITYFNDEIKDILTQDKESTKESVVTDELSLIEEVIDLSGLKRQIDQVPGFMQSQLTQKQQELKPEVFAVLNKVITESFRADIFQQYVKEYFKNNFDKERLMAVRKLWSLPLAKKMTQLEIQGSASTALEDKKAFALNLQANPPSQEHLALAQKLIDVTDSVGMLMEIYLGSTKAFITAAAQFSPPDNRPTSEQLDQMLNEKKAQLETAFRQSLIISFLYTYRSASEEELKQYIEIYDSDTGRWFTKLVFGALEDAFNKAGASMGQKIMEVIKDYKVNK